MRGAKEAGSRGRAEKGQVRVDMRAFPRLESAELLVSIKKPQVERLPLLFIRK